ncbi:MAG TPA: acetyl-CoA carboxylase carboxyltransferase subunit alpha [Terriglobales bacterium]|nr:acetyl-CoA carboxylase carboxyltransferase subunit alpha [Terriglobales bacterium]
MAAPGMSYVQELIDAGIEQIRNDAGNGSLEKMESATKAQQELEKIEKQITQLESLAGVNSDAHRQLASLHEQVNALRAQITVHLDSWKRTELARHPQRPYTLDYIERIFTDFSEIHGDRRYSDDPAIVVGMAKFHGEPVLVLGTQKGRDTKQKVYRNFGMPNPEGYRKAIRAMKIAEKFGRPVFTLVDVPGAYPGLGAEERGQAEAIAYNLREMARLKVPIITAITGEGGSGGALAIAVADRVLILDNAIYSVISPEGCASIMWRDASKRDVAAEAMKITAPDLRKLGLIDDVVPEPAGGAHNDYDEAARLLDESLKKHFDELKGKSADELVKSRYEKFRTMARFFNEV